jgi:hypothetical protein
MVAGSNPAAWSGWNARGGSPLRPTGSVWRKAALVLASLSGALVVPAEPAAAQQVQINKLSDVAFGTITDFTTDSLSAQNVCVFSTTAQKGYNITAQGSGAASAFTLANGPATMAYEVQWNSNSGRTTGTNLSPNVALTGQRTNATTAGCTSGPLTTASLIVIIRSAALGAAAGGNYAGTLTLVIAPE